MALPEEIHTILGQFMKDKRADEIMLELWPTISPHLKNEEEPIGQSRVPHLKWDKLPRSLRITFRDMYAEKHTEEDVKLIVEQFTAQQAFKKVLEWHGIINYDEMLWVLREDLEKAAV